jgi:hypothetical protein
VECKMNYNNTYIRACSPCQKDLLHEAATSSIGKEDENNMGKRTDARSTPPSHKTLRPLPPSSKKDFVSPPSKISTCSSQSNTSVRVGNLLPLELQQGGGCHALEGGILVATCSSPSNTSVGVGELQQILVADFEAGQFNCKFAQNVRPKLDNQTTRAATRETRGLPDEQHTSPHDSPHTCPQPLNLLWLSAGAADARMHSSVGSGGGGGECHAQGGGLSRSRGEGGVRGAGVGEGGGMSRSGGGWYSSKAAKEVVLAYDLATEIAPYQASASEPAQVLFSMNE